MKVEISIGPRSYDSRVAIDGQDITKHLTGVEIKAHVSSLTEVTLFVLPSSVQITGEVGLINGLFTPDAVEALKEEARQAGYDQGSFDEAAENELRESD